MSIFIHHERDGSENPANDATGRNKHAHGSFRRTDEIVSVHLSSLQKKNAFVRYYREEARDTDCSGQRVNIREKMARRRKMPFRVERHFAILKEDVIGISSL